MSVLTFDRLTCVVEDRSDAKLCFGKKKEKTVLDGVSGQVGPGEILAVMGGSGGGKTTLLDLLYGKPSEGARPGGSVRINGQQVTSSVRKKIGYVRQGEDVWALLSTEQQLR